MGPITVLIVDDHRSFVDLLAAALDAEDEYRVVATASTVAEAVAAAQQYQPDLTLIDIELGGEDGLEAVRRIRALQPLATVVVVSAHSGPPWVTRAAEAGASAYAPKSGSLVDMLTILRGAGAGPTLVEPARLQPRVKFASREQPGTTAALTVRERQVLSLMGQGKSPAEIAKALGISTHTTRGYIKAIHLKLDARSQLQAVVTALRLGILEDVE